MVLPPNLLLDAHNATAIPAVLILYVLSSVIYLVTGLLFVEKSKNKYLLIWFLATALTGIIVLGLVFMPNVVQTLTKFFTGV